MLVSEFIENHINQSVINNEFLTRRSQQETLKIKLFKLITRKKFRRWALDDAGKQRIKNAVAYSLKNKTPIKFVFEFGGYKLWRLPSAPEVDFAEFFMLCHYISFLTPIAKLSPYGVNFYFASDDVVVSRMNNIIPSAMEDYCNSFNRLLDIIRPNLPKNLNIELVRLAGLYDTQDELEKELKNTFDDNKKKFLTWSDEKKTKMIKRAELNFCKNSSLAVYDLSNISKRDYEERLINGAVYHDAFEDCCKRKEFVTGEDSILVFCTSIPEALAIGSTKTSVTKFWTGVGVLKKNVKKYTPMILSPSNWSNLDKNNLEFADVKWSQIAPQNLYKIPIVVEK